MDWRGGLFFGGLTDFHTPPILVRLSELQTRLAELTAGRSYVRRSTVTAWTADARAAGLIALFKSPTLLWHVILQIVLPGYLMARVRKANDAFVAAEIIRLAPFFDAAPRPLTSDQRTAVVHDDDAVLLIAGAGTGKTTTIIEKARFLIDQKDIPPEKILILAFNNKVVNELTEKLAGKLTGVACKTFHAFGLSLVGAATGKKPSPTDLSGPALIHWIGLQLQNLLKDEELRLQAIRFLIYYFYPSRPNSSYKSVHEYMAQLKASSPRTLNADFVKSYGEAAIADFLFLHGIRYKYEAKYQYDTRTPQKAQYKPDFYLPDFRVYIEHFGMAGFSPAYDEQIEWKRQCHEQHQTVCVETFGHEYQSGNLEAVLKQRLEAAGVKFSPLGHTEIVTVLKGTGRFDRLSELLAAFLNLYKANGQPPLEDDDGDPRFSTFLQLFQPVFRAYQERLRKEGDVDFNDMIQLGAESLKSPSLDPGFTYVLVDEFQDLSPTRKGLLKALLSTPAKPCLFAVGDDWQAIYRFAGGDVTLTTQFGAHFPGGRVFKLEKTFRFSQELSEASGAFVMMNPGQIQKTLRSDKPSIAKPVILMPDSAEAVENILGQITGQGRKRSVLILGRYNDDEPMLSKKWPGVTFSTVHSAKGLEADFVILVNAAAGRMGFPSEIQTDPILEWLYPSTDESKNAEERRLFYVALTRARERVFILVPPSQPSEFIADLSASSNHVDDRLAYVGAKPCPGCGYGRIVHRPKGEYGPFWACSNFPQCTWTRSRLAV